MSRQAKLGFLIAGGVLSHLILSMRMLGELASASLYATPLERSGPRLLILLVGAWLCTKKLGRYAIFVSAAWVLATQSPLVNFDSPILWWLRDLGRWPALVLLAELACLYSGKQRTIALVSAMSGFYLLNKALPMLSLKSWPRLEVPPISTVALISLVGLTFLVIALWEPAEEEMPVVRRRMGFEIAWFFLYIALRFDLVAHVKLWGAAPGWSLNLEYLLIPIALACCLFGEASRWRKPMLATLTALVVTMTAIELATGLLFVGEWFNHVSEVTMYCLGAACFAAFVGGARPRQAVWIPSVAASLAVALVVSGALLGQERNIYGFVKSMDPRIALWLTLGAGLVALFVILVLRDRSVPTGLSATLDVPEPSPVTR